MKNRFLLVCLVMVMGLVIPEAIITGSTRTPLVISDNKIHQPAAVTSPINFNDDLDIQPEVSWNVYEADRLNLDLDGRELVASCLVNKKTGKPYRCHYVGKHRLDDVMLAVLLALQEGRGIR